MKRFVFLALAFAQLSVAGFPDEPDAVEVSTAPVSAEAFSVEAARHLNVPMEKVRDLRHRGFGKTEVLSFFAISSASKKPWDQLVKERERGTPLRRLAEEAGLDYNALFEKSRSLKKEIEASPPPKTGN